MKTTLQVIGGIILAIVLTVVLMVWGFGLEIFGLRLGKHVENARTEVTRSTNQYVTSGQQQLATLAKEYQRAKDAGSTAQQKLIAEQMDQIAQTLDVQYITESVATILLDAGYDNSKYREAMSR